MGNFIEHLTNIGTGWWFWLDMLILLGALFSIFMIGKSGFKLYRAFKQKDLDGGKEIRKRITRLVITFILGIMFIFALFFGYGPGEHKKEIVPANNHSLNIDIMQADSMLTDEEIELDAVENMDPDLKIFREDSAFENELKKSEEETDRELERLLK